MDGNNDGGVSRSFKQKQYTALRNEVTTRIQMRRRLVAAGLAFIATFSALIFSTASQNNDSYWLLAILPPVVGFLMIEIFRSEGMLKKSAYFIKDIEEDMLDDEEKFGWEHRYGGYSEPKTGKSLVAMLLMVLIYLASVYLAGIFWGSQPTELQWIPACGLVVGYSLALLIPVWFFCQVLDIDRENYSEKESDGKSPEKDAS